MTRLKETARDSATGDHGSTKSRIIFLDYLRIFAFASVLAGHKFYWFFENISRDPKAHATLKFFAEAIRPLYEAGGAGVIVFFLISGYIIPATLRKDSTVRFIIKRIWRIYPLYIFAVLLEHLCLLSVGKGQGWLTVLQQMTLLGDFFKVSYALGSVEWTLRIEIVFYAYMALLKSAGFLNSRSKYLSLILLLTIGGIFCASPSAYFVRPVVYAPFLLLGSLFWAREVKLVSLNLLIAATILTLVLFMIAIVRYLPFYSQSHYAAAGVLVFAMAYVFKDFFQDFFYIRQLSAITYGVYLFHNWLTFYLDRWLPAWTGLSKAHAKTASIVLLLVFCFFCNKTIERWGIRIGAALSNRSAAWQDRIRKLLDNARLFQQRSRR